MARLFVIRKNIRWRPRASSSPPACLWLNGTVCVKLPRPCTGRCAATGFARVDLFYTPDGRIVFNEVNTIPGFTEHSRFPGMMRGRGSGIRPAGGAAAGTGGGGRMSDSDPGAALAGTLALVNPAHPLQARPAPKRWSPPCRTRRRAAGAAGRRSCWQRCWTASARRGASCRQRWRSHAEQQALYADSVRDNGLEFTQKYVALPGCSEHETGLAIDVGEAREVIDFSVPHFPIQESARPSAARRRATASSNGIPKARRPSPASAMNHGIFAMLAGPTPG